MSASHDDATPLTAAWLAEHVMGWIRSDTPNDVWLTIHDDRYGGPRAWDPLANDADAMQVWLHISTHAEVELGTADSEWTQEKWYCRIEPANIEGCRDWMAYGRAETMREAICRAAQAWVVARGEG